MKLEGKGILISMRPFGERDVVANIFTDEYGVLSGMLKAAQVAKKNKPLIGQVGNFSWNARLDSQLGAFHWEAEKNLAVNLMLNKSLLEIMNSAFDLIQALLPEREKYEDLFFATLDMLTRINGDNFVDLYLNWEVSLLRDLGYALDLSCCSGCGGHENLHYLSPRTGRAVCDACAQPYLSKVYKLPLSLNTTLRFLENVCLQQGGNLPLSRKLLLKI